MLLVEPGPADQQPGEHALRAAFLPFGREERQDGQGLPERDGRVRVALGREEDQVGMQRGERARRRPGRVPPEAPGEEEDDRHESD